MLNATERSLHLSVTSLLKLWRYNFALRRWTLEETTGDGPVQTLASHSSRQILEGVRYARTTVILVCRYGNLLMVFGGTGFPFGQHVSNDLFILDLKRLHWQRCRLSNQQPQRVYGAVQPVFWFLNETTRVTFFRA